MKTAKRQSQHGSWVECGALLVCVFLILLLTGCLDSSSSPSTQRGAAPTGLREPDNPRNLYSGELRILAADRYAGYPLRGVSVEVMWSRNGISVNTARTSTDEMGFGRVALAPIQRLDTPYDAVSVKLSLPGYPAVYQEQPIHWRLIGPLPSGAEEWRFDVEIYAGL